MVAPIAQKPERPWLTPEEAGALLGCEAPTMRKNMAAYGGWRMGRKIRFDRVTILKARTQPDFAHKPNATLQTLAEELSAQAVLNKQQRLQIAQLTARVEQLEAAALARTEFTRS